MSRLISIATGNFTAAGTWGLVDDTSYLDSEAGSTASTTSYVYSSTFTPGAITVDGIAVKLANRVASPVGTITIGLILDAASVEVIATTINVSDLANTGGTGVYNRGWYYFKFATPQLLTGATLYKIGFKTSTNAEATLYRDATAGNWSRMLRTTTTQAPASADQLHVIGEHTGAGTGNSFVVTMDNTATTSFGPTVSGGPPQGVTLGKRGTMTFGTTASTAYFLKWKGVFGVHDGGTLNIGTSGTQMPSTSTADLFMDSVANVDTGFDWGHGAAVNIWGATKTNKWSLLNTDEAAAQTVIGIADTAGWAAGDELCFSSTSQTNTQAEKKTILTVDSSTQVTLTAGLTNDHSGTSPTQAEVGNLTRNIKIHGNSTTLQGYINIAATAVVTIRYAEFYNLGSATALKRGFDVATTTGTFDMQYCSLHDFIVTSSFGVNVTSASGNTITIYNNVFYNVNGTHLNFVLSSAGIAIVDGNLFCLNVAASGLVTLTDIGLTFTNNIVTSGASLGLALLEIAGSLGSFANNVFHSSANIAIHLSPFVRDGILVNTTCWRHGTASSGAVFINAGSNITFDGLTLFGNFGANFAIGANTGAFWAAITFRVINGTFNGDTTFATTNGVRIWGPSELTFDNCDFSTVTGIKTAHTNDFNIAAPALVRVNLINTKLGAATEVTGTGNLMAGSFISSQKHDQTDGLHKSWLPNGGATSGIITDTVIFNTASPSARMTPSSASLKLEHAPLGKGFKKKVDDGATVSASIYVRKSTTGDGVEYNGNQPRLIVRKNVAAGISADTVLDTMTAAVGTWEQLSGTTAAVTDDAVLEFVVDCDGTLGWINIDDFA